MKRDNINYVLVGGVVVAAIVLLLAALVAITGRSGASTDYIARYRNVTGLHDGAPVFYEGFRIGQVTAIDPERSTKAGKLETRYKVVLALRRDWPIPRDSVARLTSTGLLADVAVGISEGASAEVAKPGAELAGVENADLFASMNALAAQLGDLARNQVAPLVKTLTSHVDSIASQLDAGAPEIVAQSRQLLQRLNSASASVDDLLKPQNRAAIGAILGNAQALSQDLRATQARLAQAIGQIDGAIRENRPGVRDSVDDLRGILAALSERIDSITQNLAVASRNFNEFSREVRMSPNRLLIAPKRDKIEEEPR
ncbi:MAG: MCE family protein [Proteobacteria bacterium]|nr:MCE family protein [Pseudomonadota bacterium]